MHKQKFINFLKGIFFSPLILYFGERSPIAFDEGFYILQSKWILSTGDWISPMYWGNLYLDRTIGVQFLIAFSQKIFGENSFAFYIPSFLAGLLMLIFTNEIHKELVDKKNQIFSVLILSTTLLWINYFHMATQDIIFAAITTFGIFSTIKAFKTQRVYFFFFAGIWLGFNFMLKTYLTVIPFLGILPFLISSKIIKNKFFWIGAFVGFLPFLIWSYKIILSYGFGEFSGIYSKLLTLSKNNNFTKPFYYYLWNLPLNGLPWSIFSIIGYFNIYRLKNKISSYFLFKYPLILMIMLSIFSTKTPYYPLQILPLISINSFLGINYILKNKNSFSKIFKKIIFVFIPISLIFVVLYLNFINHNLEIERSTKLNISLCLLLFSSTWLYSLKVKSIKSKFILILLGPYFVFSIIIQNGLFNDRSKELRIATTEIIKNERLNNKKIEFIKNYNGNEISTSKLIKIAVFMPKIGEGINEIENLNSNQYAWTTIDKAEILSTDKYKIINDSEIFKPWILILKK